MLVYGDHHECADPREVMRTIEARLASMATMPAGLARHAALVTALVESGRLLQGIADADFDRSGADQRNAGTDAFAHFLHALAQRFVRSWRSGFRAADQLPAIPTMTDVPPMVELRLPEGFAHYAVYPEAYVEAAGRLVLSAPPRVIGLRSIGTTLGAVVAAAIGALPVVSVRPFGDPFARCVAVAPPLERALLEREAHYVIVDEGPGASGSSFGAMADWLIERGVPLERIALVPSHGLAPGARTSEPHRRQWEAAQRQPAIFDEPLAALAERIARDLLGPLDAPLRDISGGAWRPIRFTHEEEWPAVVSAWERRKFLASARGERFLLKFVGLGVLGERKLAMARSLHEAGFATDPVGLGHGFLVERWCEGQLLRRSERPITELARYIGVRTRLFPAEAEHGASSHVLMEMAARNVSLALGSKAAAALERWRPFLDTFDRRVMRVRTDNRFDRHEWLRFGGRLIKTDALDHHVAHDLIGCQDPAWDVAGAIVEFDLNESEADRLISGVAEASGHSVDRALLHFCRVAYLAFRVGQTALGCETAGPDRPEIERLRTEGQRYRTALQHLLQEHVYRGIPQESLVD